MRKTPMAAVDLAIGRRLQQLRKEAGWSRSEFGRAAGLDADAVARVELGRAPLRYSQAVELLATIAHRSGDGRSPINPLWLTHVKFPIRITWPFVLPYLGSQEKEHKTRFSAFVLDNLYVLEALAVDAPHGVLPESWLQTYSMGETSLWGALEKRRSDLMTFRWVFWESVERLAKTSKYAAALLGEAREIEENPNSVLTGELSPANNTVVAAPHGSYWKITPPVVASSTGLSRREARRQHWQKTLGVTPSAVAQWLAPEASGTMPTAETTLRLLQWVNADDLKPKSPGSVQAEPEPKTQVRNPKHEDQKSTRKKR